MTLTMTDVNSNEYELTLKMNLQWASRENTFIIRAHYMKNVADMLLKPEISIKFIEDPAKYDKIVSAMTDLLNEQDYKERMTLYEWIMKELREGGVLL